MALKGKPGVAPASQWLSKLAEWYEAAVTYPQPAPPMRGRCVQYIGDAPVGLLADKELRWRREPLTGTHIELFPMI